LGNALSIVKGRVEVLLASLALQLNSVFVREIAIGDVSVGDIFRAMGDVREAF
jgi:hypothetical protein